jgi:hypothetical protein
MEWLQNEYATTEFVLAGHSVGAHCMLHVYGDQTRCDQARVRACVGLQPTILNIALSPNGLVATPKLATWKTCVSSVAGALGSLPDFCIRAAARFHLEREHTSAVLQSVGGGPDANIEDWILCEVNNLLDGNVVFNVLTMAHNEMGEIHGCDTAAVLEGGIADKLVMMFSAVDGWVRPEDRASIERRLFPASQMVSLPDMVKHGFVVDTHETSVVARETWAAIRPKLGM